MRADVEMQLFTFSRERDDWNIFPPGVTDFQINVRFGSGEFGHNKFSRRNALRDSLQDIACKQRFVHTLANITASPNRFINAELVNVLKLFRKWHGDEDMLLRRFG